MADRAGQQIGVYRLERLLGKGGFAEVYLAQHRYLRTQVAIKLLYARLSPSDQQRFLAEAQIVARLSHPRIVRVLDFGVEGETPYLAMEYAPNGTLRQRHPRGTQLPLATVVAYAQQVAEALDYAHAQRLIHRDIKPENLLLAADEAIVLSDFGIATAAHSSRSLTTQDVAGTASYMAPEQFQGKPRPASDQYALGIVVYEWLTGKPPFRGSFLEISGQHLHMPPPPMRERCSDLPLRVEDVVLTALAKDPKERFASVQTFANALTQAAQLAQPEPAQPYTDRSTLPLAPPEAATRPAPASTMPPAGAQTERGVPHSPPDAARDGGATGRSVSPVAPASVPAWGGVRRGAFPRGRQAALAGVSAAVLVALLVSLSLVFRAPQGTQAGVSATGTAGAQQTGTAAAATVSAIFQNSTANAGANDATATARALLQPYTAPAPACDKDSRWSVETNDPQATQCLADKLRLTAVPDPSGGTSNFITFIMQPFPQKFSVSMDVSNIVGSQVHLDFGVSADNNAVGIDMMLDTAYNTPWYIERTNERGTIIAPYPDRAVSTLLFRLDGLQTTVWVNGSQIASFNELAPLAVDQIRFLLASDGSRAQVDLQNFVFTPIP